MPDAFDIFARFPLELLQLILRHLRPRDVYLTLAQILDAISRIAQIPTRSRLCAHCGVGLVHVQVRGPQSASALVRLAGTSNVLKHFHLFTNDLSDPAVLQTVLHGIPPSTKELRLDECNIGPEGARILATSLTTGAFQLELLSVAQNPLGDEGTEAIVRSLRHQKTLCKLNLTETKLGVRGRIALAELLSEHWSLWVIGSLDNNWPPGVPDTYRLLQEAVNRIREAIYLKEDPGERREIIWDEDDYYVYTPPEDPEYYALRHDLLDY